MFPSFLTGSVRLISQIMYMSVLCESSRAVKMIFDVLKSFYNPYYQDFGLSPSRMRLPLPSQEGIIILLPLILSLGMLVWSPGRTSALI